MRRLSGHERKEVVGIARMRKCIINMETGSLRISDIRPDFIYMMEQAVKAPSGHNTQPWLFRVQKDRIQILPDMSKSLPAVDPDNRE